MMRVAIWYLTSLENIYPKILFPKFYIKYRVTRAVIWHLRNIWNNNIKYHMTRVAIWYLTLLENIISQNLISKVLY